MAEPFGETRSPAAGVASITPAELKRRLDQGEPVALLDVREDQERSFCALPAACVSADLHVPLGLIPSRLDAIQKAAQAAPLVIYCHHGIRSMVAARWLAARALGTFLNLDGGIDAYAIEVDPTMPRY